MARPVKQTVDYFPHDADASEGRTISILENNFGLEGYAVWFKLLERISRTNNQVIACRNAEDTEFLAAKMKVSVVRLLEILNKLADLEAIDKQLWGEHIIWCDNLVKRLTDVYKNRKQAPPIKPLISTTNNPVILPETPVSTPDNPQSKVNKSKVNKSKVNKEIETLEDYKPKLRQRFADLDFDVELERFNLYWAEGGRTLKRPKLALLNWMTIAERRRKEGHGGKATRDISKAPFAGWREIAGQPEDSGSISEGEGPGAGTMSVDS